MNTGWVDVTVGAGTWLVRTGVAVSGPARSLVQRVVPVVLHPPGLPAGAHPARVATALAERGAEERAAVVAAAEHLLDVVVPQVVAAVLERLHLTELVLGNVDLDAVVAAVDLDGAVARVDVDAVVARADLDGAVGRVDLDAIVERLDLTELVLTRVDLERLVDAVLARVDLLGLAQEVIDGVDLPAIIRESTGSMASDTVRGARMQSIAADEAVGKAVDRLLLRRRHEPVQPVLPGQRQDER
jgi:hypothetical protein